MSGNSSGRISTGRMSTGRTQRPSKKAQLILIKGRDRIHARMVECNVKSLNHSDVFILDTGPKIYVWTGVQADRKKREKGVNVAHNINKSQRRSKSEVIIYEDGSSIPNDFWEPLGVRSGTATSALNKLIENEGGDDSVLEKQWNTGDRLYRVNPGMDLFKIEGEWTAEKLTNTFTYILDCGPEFYVWCGKKTSEQRRTDTVKKAKEMFYKAVRPPWALMKKISEGQEPVLFQEKFWGDWSRYRRTGGSQIEGEGGEENKRVSSGRERRGTGAPGMSSSALAVAAAGGAGAEREEGRYSYEDLKAGNYPVSLNTDQKESYLSDGEFERIFKMTKAEFYKLPSWKISNLRKEAGLF
eukprot:TRINITY_DN14381_c0_g1_i3.p1 TRINITY_DN14381_c0_g1~~TRINITY_DN14381_c0_g1_i3.p1  ORF type:complete len:355 (+),score=111.64 TRINITY_DN14381_c0_g1_i3:156-1220(+)